MKKYDPYNITSNKYEANTEKIKINSMKEIEKENSEIEEIEKRILRIFKDKINSSLIFEKNDIVKDPRKIGFIDNDETVINLKFHQKCIKLNNKMKKIDIDSHFHSNGENLKYPNKNELLFYSSLYPQDNSFSLFDNHSPIFPQLDEIYPNVSSNHYDMINLHQNNNLNNNNINTLLFGNIPNNILSDFNQDCNILANEDLANFIEEFISLQNNSKKNSELISSETFQNSIDIHNLNSVSNNHIYSATQSSFKQLETESELKNNDQIVNVPKGNNKSKERVKSSDSLYYDKIYNSTADTKNPYDKKSNPYKSKELKTYVKNLKKNDSDSLKNIVKISEIMNILSKSQHLTKSFIFNKTNSFNRISKNGKINIFSVNKDSNSIIQPGLNHKNHNIKEKVFIKPPTSLLNKDKIFDFKPNIEQTDKIRKNSDVLKQIYNEEDSNLFSEYYNVNDENITLNQPVCNNKKYSEKLPSQEIFSLFFEMPKDENTKELTMRENNTGPNNLKVIFPSMGFNKDL
jgi:hypothetical protein